MKSVIIFLFLSFGLSAQAQTCKNTELYDAVDRTNLNKVTELLASGADVNERSCYGRTPIMATTWWSIPPREDNLKILDLLISKGADVNIQDNYGDTALMVVARNGHYQVIRQLIQSHADVNLVNRDGNNVLMNMLGKDAVNIEMELLN